jgi:ribonuclease HI
VSWEVWCDGSGTTGGPAGIGYVAHMDGKPHHQGQLPLPNATNQQAEILAAAYALHCLPPGQVVTVYSDSEYLVKYVDASWGWRANGWSKGRGRGLAKNIHHWLRLHRAISAHRHVNFKWVRGHADTPGNVAADRLAGEARMQARAQAQPLLETGT